MRNSLLNRKPLNMAESLAPSTLPVSFRDCFVANRLTSKVPERKVPETDSPNPSPSEPEILCGLRFIRVCLH